VLRRVLWTLWDMGHTDVAGAFAASIISKS